MADRPTDDTHQPPIPGTPPPAGQWSIDAVYRHGQFVPLTPLSLPAGMPIIVHLGVRAGGVPSQHANSAPSSGPSPTVEAISATYERGVIRPAATLGLAEGTPVQLHLSWQLSILATVHLGEPTGAARAMPEPRVEGGAAPVRPVASGTDDPAPLLRAATTSASGPQALAAPLGQSGLLATLTRLDLLLLFLVVVVVYAPLRYIGLTKFPIYFFSDEAIGTNLGLDLIHNGLRDRNGVFLPPYFRNDNKWNLSLSVYLQGISAFIFGKSVLVNRVTSASSTLLAAVTVALALRLVFRVRYWWVGPLALAALPVWFVHSRTSFETVMMASFYACFVCAYLIYRYHDPRYLVAVIAFGAATFYSYANGQGVMVVSGLLLLLSDFRYHLRTLSDQPVLRNAVVIALALAATPYLRFRSLYPDALGEHLRVMNSIWIRDVSLADKLRIFAQNYAQGLSPTFWFAPNNGIDLARHTLKGWGNFPRIFLPPLLIGLAICLREWRSAAHRAVLIGILAAPFSGALATIHNYRALAMVVPAAFLVALGIDRVAGWLSGRRVPATLLPLGIAGLLVGMNVAMLRAALVDGPTQYNNYGLYGMQYGAMQVFPAITTELENTPQSEVIVSPGWANNPNEFVPFFLPEALRGRVTFRSPQDYLTWKQEMKPTTLFVLPAEDYDLVRASPKLVVEPPTRVVPYPDGQAGFYFVHLRYVANIDALFAAEREARSKPIEERVTLDGQTVRLRHSMLDLGSVANLFDDDHRTLIRGFEANPLMLEFEFPEARTLRSIGLDFWRFNLQLTVTIDPDGGGPQQTYTAIYRDLPVDPHVDFVLPGGPTSVRTLRIELLDLNGGDRAKIHVPGIQLR